MKEMNFLFLFALIILSSNCATIILGTTQELSISSIPTAALVTNNGLQLGKTPLLAELKRKGTHRIRIELDGYETYEIFLTRKTSDWVWGNIIFGGLIGLVVDAITGGMYVLTPEEIHAELRNKRADITLNKNQIFIAVTLKANPSRILFAVHLWH